MPKSVIRLEELRSSREAGQQASDELISALSKHENGQSLFLVSGGSSAEVAFWASSQLDINVTNSTILAQVDERYGPPGHTYSNWELLLDKGIDPSMFEQALAMLELGTSAVDVAESYGLRLATLLDESEYSVALLGLGADGHIAGIMPMNSNRFSELFLASHLVSAYRAPDFERITVTAPVLMQMDKIVVFASGAEKADAVAKLNTPQIVSDYPAEILKRCRDVVVYYGKEK